MKIYAVVCYVEYFGYCLDESYFFKSKENAEKFLKEYFEDNSDNWEIVEIIVEE